MLTKSIFTLLTITQSSLSLERCTIYSWRPNWCSLARLLGSDADRSTINTAMQRLHDFSACFTLRLHA